MNRLIHLIIDMGLVLLALLTKLLPTRVRDFILNLLLSPARVSQFHRIKETNGTVQRTEKN